MTLVSCMMGGCRRTKTTHSRCASGTCAFNNGNPSTGGGEPTKAMQMDHSYGKDSSTPNK
eukprot:CAMPEP_0198291302 /NCGR_PEP_ID=MMETSP1449-20131203/8874_1 /TAXON_ID=420275 /ORGANISM="Attheya septentrionalis, Strain CCMP2084" /LENGTH=59 /DNA_ID=CAMNT_0043989919 /DNA_START=214 /DNA_END=393 /DNA_ORIENTATION=-